MKSRRFIQFGGIMTREEVRDRARRAIPDFLRRREPEPPKVPPASGSEGKPGKIDWHYLFRLAESQPTETKGEKECVSSTAECT